MFKLEVLKAKHGDCLMLHHGDDSAPRHILIDGGPRGVFRKHLKPRLKALQNGGDAPVKLDLVMISHIDHDHIRGVIDLVRELSTAEEDNAVKRLADIRTLWHNAFADFTPAARPAESAALQIADIAEPDIDLVLQAETKLVLSSVKEGRELRNLARKLKIDVNPDAASGLVLSGHAVISGDLTLTVIGPTQRDADDLKESWDKEVEKLLRAEKEKQMEAAAYLDDSVFNLSSLVVLAEMEGKRMLLTGDARGDRILENLHDNDLLDADGRVHVDLLKLPHHGSDRNVEEDFFRRVTADRYVISGDGRHHNPELETYRMLFKARGEDAFELYVTYPPEDMRGDYPTEALEDLLDEAVDANPRIVIHYPDEGEHSLTIDMDQPPAR